MINLKGLFPLLQNETVYRSWVDKFKSGQQSSTLSIVAPGRPYLVSSLFDELNRSILFVVSNEARAKYCFDQLLLFLGEECVCLFPQPELLPYQRAAIDRISELDIISALSTLSGRPQKYPRVFIISIDGLSQTLPAPDTFAKAWNTISVGTEIPPFTLIALLNRLGYRPENLAEMPGTYSRRGGIVDIFPPIEDIPVRLEYFGDTVESLRAFDPATQCSLKRLGYVDIGPATLLLDYEHIPPIALTGLDYELQQQYGEELEQLERGCRSETSNFWSPYINNSSLLDYLSEDFVILIDEPESISQAAEAYHEEAENLRIKKFSDMKLPRDYPMPYIEWGTLKKILVHFPTVGMVSWGTDAGNIIELPIASATPFVGRLSSFFKKISELKEQGKNIIIASYQSERLQELLNEEGVVFSLVDNLDRPLQKGSIILIHSLIDSGWVLGGEIYLFTDRELFGFIKARRQTRRRASLKGLALLELKPGDYVVHIDHGVARFSDTVNIQVSGALRDYLLLEYAAGDRLYVPTDQIDRVTHYIGADGEIPTLNRMGSQEWGRSKERAKEAAEEAAAELIELYATRQIVPGYAYTCDTIWQKELEGSFSYIETPDQAQALIDVKQDMEKPQPMDRLILGDVGYGKTEVALRAAFKAVMDGKQVAVLVPTTVLAQQHYVTFKNRLAAFPLKMETLSRFRSDKEQKTILDSLKSGAIDIIIGTHRLLQSDVNFKQLGLLIVDEEQRFGVMHKEFLKRIRQEIDVLTLSATPIPRTLQLSLVGIRDMSIIETPPNERLPVKTIVAPYEDQLVREAILRERERGGQVFFVHNRVQSIHHITNRLRKLVPEVTFVVGHGQMQEHDLETVMARFADGTEDILVCTTIIESGLDVPNANTIIINHADRFGLTQLYQLRGRVGRGTNLAYAYLLYEKGKRITGNSEKRLRTIFEASELGAGYGIAMRDLEIRGAGTLLGTRQSGQISAVGFNLYNELLAEAVVELKVKLAGKEAAILKPSKITPPTIELPISAFIPDSYVIDEQLRLSLYKRLTTIKDNPELTTLEQELTDRFGAVPSETYNLLYIIRLRLLGLKAGVKAIGIESGLVTICFLPGIQPDFYKISPSREGIRISTHKIWLDYLNLGIKWREILEETIWRLGR